MKHLKLIGACALIGAFAATPASAEWANSTGIGQKTSNLGGAGVATASDFDVFYTNPAGAANMKTTTIGVGVKVLNTTNLDNRESSAAGAFNHDVEDTVTGSENAYLPAVGAYIPGLLPNVVLGVGFGAPFGLAADWGSQQPNPGVIGAINFQTVPAVGAGPNGANSLGFQKVEALTAEIAPTIGINVSDKLRVGASVGFTTLKHVKLDIGVALSAGDLSAVNNLAGNPLGCGLACPAATTLLQAQSSDDIGLPIPPWEFATSPHEATYTLGMQYQLLPNVAIGAAYREETPTEHELNLAIDLGPLLAPLGGSPSGIDRSTGTVKLEIPRHLQIGATVDLMPGLRVSADVKWTNWANATGIGSPLVVQINQGGVLLGALARQLVLNNNGDDTYSFHLGAQYKVLPNLELQAGYNYDPAVFDTPNLSYLFYSSDRHIYSLGATLDLPDAALFGSSGNWEFTVGGQLIHYEDITVQPGQSQTFGLGPGGLTLAELAGFGGTGSVDFAPNGQSFEIGGYVWTAGFSAVYKFGAPEEMPLK